ncbi:MAG: class I SAM-dependent methyltransferase [Candidatus Bathyarchaeia archaeon]
MSEDMLRIAVRKVEKENLQERVTVKVGDICKMDFPDEIFDFALAEGDPLSYCSNSDKVVSEFYRVLKPKCFAVAGVDNTYSLVRSTIIHQQNVPSAFRVLREKDITQSRAASIGGRSRRKI